MITVDFSKKVSGLFRLRKIVKQSKKLAKCQVIWCQTHINGCKLKMLHFLVLSMHPDCTPPQESRESARGTWAFPCLTFPIKIFPKNLSLSTPGGGFQQR